MDSIERAVIDKKIAGWAWVREQFAAARDRCRAEADRLLGPERGE